MQNGKLIERNMKQERRTEEDVMEQARLQHRVETLDDAKWAVLGTGASISVARKR